MLLLVMLLGAPVAAELTLLGGLAVVIALPWLALSMAADETGAVLVVLVDVLVVALEFVLVLGAIVLVDVLGVLPILEPTDVVL